MKLTTLASVAAVLSLASAEPIPLRPRFDVRRGCNETLGYGATSGVLVVSESTAGPVAASSLSNSSITHTPKPISTGYYGYGGYGASTYAVPTGTAVNSTSGSVVISSTSSETSVSTSSTEGSPISPSNSSSSASLSTVRVTKTLIETLTSSTSGSSASSLSSSSTPASPTEITSGTVPYVPYPTFNGSTSVFVQLQPAPLWLAHRGFRHPESAARRR
ncbi:hypothetical protein BJ546DRAFT_590754 [Cryomyces antarcticus]